MRTKIISKLLEKQDQSISVKAGVDGLFGMAQCSYTSDEQSKVVDIVIERLSNEHFTFY